MARCSLRAARRIAPISARLRPTLAIALTLAPTLTARDGVRIDRWFGPVLRRAVDGAAARLAEPDCAAVLDDFRDREGRPLRAHLPPEASDAASYVRRVLFYDGTNEVTCKRTGVYAFTVPGSHVVRACPALGRLADIPSDGGQVEAVVIHELLHTLGLGENPPTSQQITAAVRSRCGG